MPNTCLGPVIPRWKGRNPLEQKIVIINGLPGSGKDTFVEMCQKHSEYTVKNISTVDKVKNALAILGWDGLEKTPEVRRLLSDLKDISTKHFDGPYSYVMDVVRKDMKRTDIIFIHCREPEEIMRFVVDLKAITVLIDRPDHKPETTNHADENIWLYKHYDVVITNDSLVGLKFKAVTFANALMGGIYG